MEISKDFLIIALVIVGFMALASLSMTQIEEVPEDMDAFAKCLTDNGARMYGAYWCGHCNEQKESFGESWEFIDYVECSYSSGGQALECSTAGIKAYPTWEFKDGSRLSGRLSFEELSRNTGCGIN